MASIKDVAKKAGVGIATVSRVLNDSGYVKKETREKVEKVIAELEFKPNEIARSMTKQQNNIVAFILPNTTHIFFGELLNRVEDELFEHGYKLLVCNSSESLEKELTYLEMLRNNRVDACIILTNNDIENHLPKDRPIISFDRYFEGVTFVSSDNYKGGELAAEHLIMKGCKNLMYVGDDSQGETTKIITEVSKRRSGFLDYAKEKGFTNVVNIEYPLNDYEDIPEEIHKKILSYTKVDGIFCISDTVACQIIKDLEENGRRVPEDVKVIGYDGGKSFLNLGKRITSIAQYPELIAQSICESIVDYYNKKDTTNRILPVDLVQGETT